MTHLRNCQCCNSPADRADKPFISANTLARHCPLDGFKYPRLSFHQPAVTSQHGLQSLPVELYHACLQYLDLGTIMSLRRVSQSTRQIVESLHEYLELSKYALDALRACVATGVAERIPIQRLHQSLTSCECYYCKISNTSESNFGSYLSLFEGRRVCLFCLRNNPALRPVELTTLVNLCMQRSSTIDLSKTSRFSTIPGFYAGFKGFPYVPRTRIVHCTSIKPYSGQTLTEQQLTAIMGNAQSAVIYHHPLIAPEEESDIRPNQDYVPSDSLKQILYRYATVVAFPYLVPSREKCEMGVFCKDCVLSMLYHEEEWKRVQAARAIGRHLPNASEQRVASINNKRKMACRQYITFQGSTQVGNGSEITGDLLIKEHHQSHRNEIMSPQEREWRKSFSLTRVPPDSILRLQKYA